MPMWVKVKLPEDRSLSDLKSFRTLIHIFLFVIASLMANTVSVASDNQGGYTKRIEANEPLRIVYFTLEMQRDSPWRLQLENVVRQSEQALDVEIEIIYMPLVRREIIEIIRDRVLSAAPFDVAVLANHQDEAPEVIKILSERGIKTFLVHEGMAEMETSFRIGMLSDSKLYPTQILPDDEQGGYELLQYLTHAARKNKLRGIRLRTFALSGGKLDQSSALRVSGLNRALSDNADVELVHLTGARWNRNVAKFKVMGMLSRYGKPDIIWCANDEMALGAIDAFAALNLSLEDVYIGGFDWSPEAIDRIIGRQMTASMGGHQYDLFFAFALAKLNAFSDELKGDVNRSEYHSRLTLLDHYNANKYREFLLANHYSSEQIQSVVFQSKRAGFSLSLLQDSTELVASHE